ncbi:NADH dehydrogenase subunit K [Chryseolinea serpens]|jgi:NADH-quinone oxidoreductase subunit K|uniref:NADH-quinone oxidoreductase subunit K n=1 Tax=Chryseolinea serpens TaxID=947013 RepID=A0A1M5N8B4_9BACT|nr:NADH-quinone oxidoreductase subunit NuoK [Chryseolinea serpens]SHG85705.1 NADH dehydrogenase subunit K [Chryseolinea serpens]
MNVPVHHFLYLGAFLFSVGLVVVISKRNTILVLLGLELMLNASNLNLVAFNRLHPGNLQGQMFAIFVIVVAVCEAAVGLAIVLRIYREYQTSVPDDVNELNL